MALDNEQKLALHLGAGLADGYLVEAKSIKDTNKNQNLQTTVSGLSSTVDSLATVATSGSYNDLSNKPTIPAAAGAGTITITQGSTSQSFNVNQSGDTTITLTAGSTPGAGILTVKQGVNETTRGTFSANASSDSTITIKDEVIISATQPIDSENNLWLDTSEDTTTWEEAIGLGTSTVAGLVKPVAKTSAMTQEVGIDSSTGRLYTTALDTLLKSITGYSASGTLVLKSVNGTIQWISE